MQAVSHKNTVLAPDSATQYGAMSGFRFGALKNLFAPLLIITALLPCTYLCWQARGGSQFGYLQDDELYLTAARSLVTTGAYKIPSLPGEPYQTKYPPIYPLLLSAVWIMNPVFPANLQAFALLDWGLWICFVAVAFVMYRQLKLNRASQLLAVILLTLNSTCQFMATLLAPEALFSIFVLTTLLLADRSSRDTGSEVMTIYCGLAAGCAFLTKTAGFPLMVTVPLVLLLRHQHRRALYFGAVVTPFVASWAIWAGAHRSRFSDPTLMYYVDYFGFYKLNVGIKDFPALVVHNFLQILYSLPGVVPPWPDELGLLVMILTAIALIGTVRLLKDTRSLHFAAFLVVYVIELLVWNFNPNGRFLYPLIPIFIAGLSYEVWFGVDLIRKTLPGALAGDLVGKLVPACLIGISLFASAAYAHSMVARNVVLTRQWTANRKHAYDWINQHLPTSAKFAAYDDVGLYLYTGRQGIRSQGMTRPYVTGDREQIEKPVSAIADFARGHGLDYLIWAPDDYDTDGVLEDGHLRERLLAKNSGLSLVYGSEGVRIYRVDSER